MTRALVPIAEGFEPIETAKIVDVSLRERLEALYAAVDAPARIASDPIAFVRRYRDPRDVEIAGVVAASLAFGRVDLFRPVLAEVFRQLDLRGGPRAYVEGFDVERDGPALRPLVYRWNRGVDFVLLFAVLRRVLQDEGSLERIFCGADAREALITGVERLRATAVSLAPAVGLSGDGFGALPRGFRYFLPSPVDGSACKRWNMFLRWMVRPPREGIDFGIWSTLRPSQLIVPLDVHVARTARFVGLTDRTDGSWRTAVEVTEGLRALDSEDPLRFDFAIAHLGISGACEGRFVREICPECPLYGICREAAPARAR